MSTTAPDIPELVLSDDAEALRQEAIERLRKRRDFKAHLLVFVLFNTVIWAIWLVIAVASSGGWWPWPIFPTFFWGIGVVMQAWDVYWRKPITEAEVDDEVRRLRSL